MDSRKDENKLILPPCSATDHKAISYFSIGSRQSFCACVPCKGATGANFVTCPTCQGTGKIPRELEKQLVALIPYGDQRLKPRHTKLFMFLAVLVCLVTTFLLSFFMFPRSMDVPSLHLNSSIVVSDDTNIYFNITSFLSITNSNYCPITVTQLTLSVLHLSLVVGQLSKSIHLEIGPLASKQISYEVATKIQDESTHKICTWPEIKVHNVFFQIQAILTYSYLSHSEQVVFESYEYLDCRGNTSLPHLLASRP